MYLRLKLETESDIIVTRKTLLCVGAIHIIFILILYLSGIVQNFFWSPAPQAIAVSLAGPATFQEMRAMAAASRQRQAQSQKQKTKNKKQIQKVPAKKTWKPLDISQITKPTETQIKEFKPVRKTTSTNTIEGLSASSIAANLKKSLNSVKFSSNGSGTGIAQANSAMAAYYDSISSFLYERWDQPSKLSPSGEPPSVLIRLKITSDGRLADYQIIKNSSFPEMNKSVKQMLDSIERLPAPPDGDMIIEATLILTN